MPIKDPEARRKYQRERKRARYHADPEYRAHLSEIAAKSRTKNAPKIKADKAAYYAKNIDKIRAIRRAQGARDEAYRAEIKRQYSLTKDDYDELYARANGRCEICGESQKSLCVDHCHRSKFVRGLLCKRCNMALGYFRDRVDLMRRGITYLRRAIRELPTDVIYLEPLQETLAIKVLEYKTTYRRRVHRERNCAYCGKEFTAFRVTREYCSNVCRAQFGNRKRKERRLNGVTP